MEEKEEFTREQELIFNLFAQACEETGSDGEAKYDHYCMSAYEQAQAYLIEEGIIKEEDCIRP